MSKTFNLSLRRLSPCECDRDIPSETTLVCWLVRFVEPLGFNAWKLHLKLRWTQNIHNNDTEVVSWFCSIQIIKKERFQEVIIAHSPFLHLSLQSLWYYWNELQPFLSDEKQQLQTALAVSSVSAMCSLVPRSPWRLDGVGSSGAVFFPPKKLLLHRSESRWNSSQKVAICKPW